jgi:MFS family permease
VEALNPRDAGVRETAPASSSLKYAWYVVIVLLSCYTLSFVNRQILTLLFAPIKHDLAISDTRVGLLQGFAFAIFYALFGLPLGRIADTSSRRNLIAAGIGLWSVMTCLCAAAGSFWSLFFMRVGVGVGEATLSPAAFSLISDYFPKKLLARAISVYQMGIFIGTGIALLVGGMVVDAMIRVKTATVPLLGTIASWRLSFLAVGLPGFLFVFWLYTVREPNRRGTLRTTTGQANLSVSQVFAQAVMRWQSIVGIAVGMIVQSLCSYAYSGWAPAFFQRVHGWSASQTGSRLGIIFLIFGCTGMYVGGLLSDRWQQEGTSEAPLKVGVISAVGTGCFFVTAMLVPNAIWSLVLSAPAIFFLAMPIGCLYASVQMILPNQVRGQVSAFVMFVLNLGGISLGPLLPGLFNDYLFKDEKMIGPSVALTIGIASILQFVIFRATYAPYRRHYALMHPASSPAITTA